MSEQLDIFGPIPQPIQVPAAELRAGHICPPGTFGIKNPRDRILIVRDARPCAETGYYADHVEFAMRVGGGPVVHGALQGDLLITVVERGFTGQVTT